MHLIPLICDNFYTCRPYRQAERMLLDAMGLLMPLVISQEIKNLIRPPTFFYQPRRSEISKSETKSEAATKEDQFQVSLDVQHFSPEEIIVKTSGDDTIIVEAKHEEKPDDHGHISRQIVRKYRLPNGHDINKVRSKLSADGILTIIAPKVKENKTTIPVEISDDIPSEFIEKKELKDVTKLEIENDQKT